MRYDNRPWEALKSEEKVERLRRDLDAFIDHETEQLKTRAIRFEALGRAHDAMSVQLAALTAIIGAITERSPPTEGQITEWAAEIAKQSGDQSQTAIQRLAMDLLKGLPSSARKTTPKS